MLVAEGDGVAWVNGTYRGGDVYGYGWMQLPVELHPGTNDFLFSVPRGRFRASLQPVTPNQRLQIQDATLPDLLLGEGDESWGSVVVINPSTEWIAGWELRASVGARTLTTAVPRLPPLGVFKSPFRIPATKPTAPGELSLELALAQSGRRSAFVSQRFTLRVRRPTDTYRKTFRSEIDDSVQYYAVNPSSSPGRAGQALFLSLHGASVEALGQASAYAPKRWGNLISPTNRRPYGFDWEDWGRWDALEVLDLATAAFRPDPSQVYLTGHSMGGHGTWNFGATFPDRFAAIAPSAGWISFWSYAGAPRYTNPTPIEQILLRSAAGSDTLALSTNYLQHGIYVLHGDADDNVPVSEARNMRAHLAGFHRDVDWHEQPGAGHWWESSDEPGAECVDWPPMFDFFARHRRPGLDSVRSVDFTTVNPAVSARDQWLTIGQAEHSLQPSRAQVQFDPGLRRFRGTTVNARHLVLTQPAGEVPAARSKNPHGAKDEANRIVLELDGDRIEVAESASLPLELSKRNGHWHVGRPIPVEEKGPHRAGPFKEAFRHRMVFVIGTQGTEEENGWALAKARMDSEAFWYRGNASIEIIPDTAYSLEKYRDRGTILYGHRESNAAWNLLLADSPVQVGRGVVTVGSRRIERNDLACLFLRPRRDSATACVGVVAASGITGFRLTQRLPYFLAGTGFPDCLVVGPEMLLQGTSGVVTAGFFGPDWSVEEGDFAWGL
jgi:poly(3-hydroxybutyrate) depolymerase